MLIKIQVRTQGEKYWYLDNIEENCTSIQLLIPKSYGCIIFSRQQVIVNSEI